MKTNKKFMFLGILGGLVLTTALSFVPSNVEATTFSPINGNTTLKVGSRGADVTSLQQFMASNSDIYPSGLVTGYFGSMTKAAAVQLQLSYNLSADGIVGANTRNVVNNVIATGRGIDISGPQMNNFSVVTLARTATISFNSNEPVKVAVFYDTNKINWSNWNDAVMSLNTPTISGTANKDDSFSLSKQITLSNLSANTTYNYTVTATDPSGNTSVIWPSTFTIGQ
jgi:hypothetical protein